MAAQPDDTRPRDRTGAERQQRRRDKLRAARELAELPTRESVQKLLDAELIPCVWTTQALRSVLADFVNWQCSTPGMIEFLGKLKREQARDEEIKREVFGDVQLDPGEDMGELSDGGEIFPEATELLRRVKR